MLALESRIGTMNAELYDRVHEALGMHPDLTTLAWDGKSGPDEDGATDADGEPPTVEATTAKLGTGPPTACLPPTASGGQQRPDRVVHYWKSRHDTAC